MADNHPAYREKALVALAALTDQSQTDRLREAVVNALKILERNLHRQTEKCDDAVNILRAALSETRP